MRYLSSESTLSPIYKYTSEKYVNAFIRRGELMFRSLSYYKEDEEQQVRGDKHEGTRLYQKPEGLLLTMVESGESRIFNGSLESNAQSDDIFVLCISMELSSELAHDFGATICVEIHNPVKLIAGIGSALIRRPSVKNKTLLNGPVTYYDARDKVGVEWAFPDRIAISKTKHYEKQKEYRIGFGVNDALTFQNTSMRLVTDAHVEPRTTKNHRTIFIKIGDLRRYCAVWRFGLDGMPIKKHY